MKKLLQQHSIAFLVSVVLLAGLFETFSKVTDFIDAKKEHIVDARNTIVSFEQNKKTLSQEAITFEALKERVDTLESFIVTPETLPALLSSLEEMAQKRNIDFTITGVSDNEKQTTHGQLVIDFSANGALSNLEGLVRDMMSQSYQVVFKTFSLYRSNNEKGEQWELLAKIAILSF